MEPDGLPHLCCQHHVHAPIGKRCLDELIVFPQQYGPDAIGTGPGVGRECCLLDDAVLCGKDKKMVVIEFRDRDDGLDQFSLIEIG